jgi:hypothetical protein
MWDLEGEKGVEMSLHRAIIAARLVVSFPKVGQSGGRGSPDGDMLSPASTRWFV